jgi:sirohydrochlorin cobaltochelatase
MKAVVLIGHGGVPKDFPSEKVGRLRMLEAGRQKNNTKMSDEEKKLDCEIRSWPRTPKNDPFHFGILSIAKHLQNKIGSTKLVIAYNEFCGPSIEEATEQLVRENYKHVVFLTTMFTPGGVHSEFEIPATVDTLKKQYPNVQFEYPWPFNMDRVATFLSAQLL